MSLRINTNVGALNAYGNLSANQASLQDAFEKLSSGLRINKAADDAAGLSISQGLTSQINGLTQAVRNAQDGTNVAQIADGALNTVQQILQRERDLAVQAANGGSQDAAAQTAAQSEITNLNTQLDNISKTTAFGGTKLLDGTYNGTFQVGANNSANEQLTLALTSSDSTTLGVNGVSVSTTAGAQTRDRHHRRRDRHGVGLPVPDRCHPEPARLHHQQPADHDPERDRVAFEHHRRRPGDGGHGDEPGADSHLGRHLGAGPGELRPAGHPEAAAVVTSPPPADRRRRRPAPGTATAA